MRTILALAILAFAAPALAEMDGPMAVVDKTQCTTSGTPPVTTCATVPGLHYIVSANFYAAHADVLAQYKDASQTNLQAVYAGDDPAHPTNTVALTFPDQATLDSVKAQVGLASAP